MLLSCLFSGFIVVLLYVFGFSVSYLLSVFGFLLIFFWKPAMPDHSFLTGLMFLRQARKTLTFLRALRNEGQTWMPRIIKLDNLVCGFSVCARVSIRSFDYFFYFIESFYVDHEIPKLFGSSWYMFQI